MQKPENNVVTLPVTLPAGVAVPRSLPPSSLHDPDAAAAFDQAVKEAIAKAEAEAHAQKVAAARAAGAVAAEVRQSVFEGLGDVHTVLDMVSSLPIIGDVAKDLAGKFLGGLVNGKKGDDGTIASLSLELGDRNRNGRLDVSVVGELGGVKYAPICVDLDAGEAFALFTKLFIELRNRIGGRRAFASIDD